MSRWERFFSERVDARPLALCRLIIGAAAFLRGLAVAHLLDRFLAEGVVRARPYDWLPEITPAIAAAYVALLLITSALFAAGYRTRVSGSLLTVLLACHLIADQNLYFNHVYMLSLLVFLLTVADSGADLSADWLRGGRSAAAVLKWPLVLIQAQISIVYFYTGIAKVNDRLLSGTVLRDGLALPAALHGVLSFEALAWATVVLELALTFGLWIPRIRAPIACLGIMFHVLIPLTMHMYAGLIVFSMIITAPYLLFFPASLSHVLVNFASRFLPSRLRSLPREGGLPRAEFGHDAGDHRSSRYTAEG
jgi:hypothetical protein